MTDCWASQVDLRSIWFHDEELRQATTTLFKEWLPEQNENISNLCTFVEAMAFCAKDNYTLACHHTIHKQSGMDNKASLLSHAYPAIKIVETEDSLCYCTSSIASDQTASCIAAQNLLEAHLSAKGPLCPNLNIVDATGSHVLSHNKFCNRSKMGLADLIVFGHPKVT